MSNLSPIWPIERQERLLADAPPDAREFRDILTGRERMARDASRLLQRELMTRSTTRKDAAEVTIVAAPPVMDWSAEGMLAVVAAIEARGGILQIIVPPLEIGPRATTSDLQELVAAFHAGKKREVAEARGRTGGAISGKRRRDASLAKLEAIRERWLFGDPREHRTADLLAEAGLTRNTVIDIIGKRRPR